MALARRAFAVSDVGFVRYLEFKPQLMTACGHGFGGFDVVQVPTNVVVGMAELPFLNIQRIAAVITALREQHTLCAALGNLNVCRNAIRAVEYVGSGVDRHTLGARVKHVRRSINRDLRALIGKTRRAARVNGQDIVLAGFDVPGGDHLDQFRAVVSGDVVVLREVLFNLVKFPVLRIQLGQFVLVDRRAEEHA